MAGCRPRGASGARYSTLVVLLVLTCVLGLMAGAYCFCFSCSTYGPVAAATAAGALLDVALAACMPRQSLRACHERKPLCSRHQVQGSMLTRSVLCPWSRLALRPLSPRSLHDRVCVPPVYAA